MANENFYPTFTEVITWPQIQDLMQYKGFRQNAILINSEKGLEKYGSSAYRVNPKWLKQIENGEVPICEDDENDELIVDWDFE